MRYQYICNQAGEYKTCAFCSHADPHSINIDTLDLYGAFVIWFMKVI